MLVATVDAVLLGPVALLTWTGWRLFVAKERGALAGLLSTVATSCVWLWTSLAAPTLLLGPYYSNLRYGLILGHLAICLMVGAAALYRNSRTGCILAGAAAWQALDWFYMLAVNSVA